jgi:predicted nucleotidyltransferase
MSASHGLSTKTVQQLQTVLAGFPQVEKAVIYGSRAKGTYRTGSDIDLTLFGDDLNDRLLSQIYWAIDDLLLPYRVDLSRFADLAHPELIDHIRRRGVVLYEKEPAKAP